MVVVILNDLLEAMDECNSGVGKMPIPVFAPVIITILPLRLGKYLFFPPLKYFFNKIIDVKTLNIFKPRYRY